MSRWMPPAEWESLLQGHACPMCADMLDDENQFSYKVAEFEHSVVRFSKNQYMPGWTVVIFKRHANELYQMSPAELSGFWQDLARAAAALNAMYQPVKINYMVYGNLCPHVHCHLVTHFYDSDPHKPVNMNAQQVLLSPAEYVAKVRQMRELIATLVQE